MIVENPEAFNAWLISYIEPRCDADPHALAKYIMALLKKNKSDKDLRKVCLDQLEVFMSNETQNFVEVLFKILADKTYLPESSEISYEVSHKHKEVKSSQEERRERNNDHSSSSYGRSRYASGDSHSRKRNKSQSPHEIPKDQWSSSPDNRHSRRQRSNSPKKLRSASPLRGDHKENANTSQNKFGQNKKRCRDYDEKGFCLRGDFCIFDHGNDPLVLNPESVESVIGLSSTSSNPYSNNGSNTHEPYNPEAPGLNCNSSNASYTPQPGYQPSARGHNNNNMRGHNGNNNHSNTGQNRNFIASRSNNDTRSFGGQANNLPVKLDQMSIQNRPQHNQSTNNGHGEYRNNRNASSGPRFSNQFRQNVNSRRPNAEQQTRTTLGMRKIPPNLNTISHLNEHFSKFGTIVNLQVHYNGDNDAALVQFASNAEALAAYRSTEAVLNNRFIKVFWHCPENSNTLATPKTPNESMQTDSQESSEDISQDQLKDVKNIRDRLGKQQTPEERQAMAAQHAGLASLTNIPNQLADLVAATTVPTSKPAVFNPALLKKQYAPTTTSAGFASTPNPQVSTPITPPTPGSSFTAFTATSSNTPIGTAAKEKLMKKFDLQKKRQEIVATFMKQQKLLLEKLENAKTDKERSEIRSTLTLLAKQIKSLEEDLRKDSQEILAEMSKTQRQYVYDKEQKSKPKFAKVPPYPKKFENVHKVDRRTRKMLFPEIMENDKLDLLSHLTQFVEVEGIQCTSNGAVVTFKNRSEVDMVLSSIMASKFKNQNSLKFSWQVEEKPSEPSIAKVNEEEQTQSKLKNNCSEDDKMTLKETTIEQSSPESTVEQEEQQTV